LKRGNGAGLFASAARCEKEIRQPDLPMRNPAESFRGFAIDFSEHPRIHAGITAGVYLQM